MSLKYKGLADIVSELFFRTKGHQQQQTGTGMPKAGRMSTRRSLAKSKKAKAVSKKVDANKEPKPLIYLVEFADEEQDEVYSSLRQLINQLQVISL